jgi:putative membrane protein
MGKGGIVAFLLRWFVTAVALWLAVELIPGLSLEGPGWSGLVVMALILGLVNAFIRPVVSLIALPVTILTLGLFTFVINAAMLWLAAWISAQLTPDSRFVIDGAIAALVGALVVSVVSSVLSSIAKG